MRVSAIVLVFLGCLTALVGISTIIPAIILETISFGNASNYASLSTAIIQTPSGIVIAAGAMTFFAGLFCIYSAFSTSPRNCCPNGFNIFVVVVTIMLVIVALVVPLALSTFLSFLNTVTTSCFNCQLSASQCASSANAAGYSCYYNGATWSSFSLLNTVEMGLIITDLGLLVFCFLALSIGCCMGPEQQLFQQQQKVVVDMPTQPQPTKVVENYAPQQYEYDMPVYSQQLPSPPPPPALLIEPDYHHHHHHHSPVSPHRHHHHHHHHSPHSPRRFYTGDHIDPYIGTFTSPTQGQIATSSIHRSGSPLLSRSIPASSGGASPPRLLAPLSSPRPAPLYSARSSTRSPVLPTDKWNSLFPPSR